MSRLAVNLHAPKSYVPDWRCQAHWGKVEQPPFDLPCPRCGSPLWDDGQQLSCSVCSLVEWADWLD